MLYNNILLRTHGPHHKHKSTKGGLLYISTHYRNGVCTWPTLGRAKQFILSTAVSSFAKAQKMDNHTVGHYTTGVSTCPALRGARQFPSTSYFFMLGVYTVSTYFTTQKQYWWDADYETIHGQLLHLFSIQECWIIEEKWRFVKSIRHLKRSNKKLDEDVHRIKNRYNVFTSTRSAVVSGMHGSGKDDTDI